MSPLKLDHPWSFNRDDDRIRVTVALPWRSAQGAPRMNVGFVLPSRSNPRAVIWTTRRIIYFARWSISPRPCPQRKDAT